jgi:hypothetical protein
MPVAALQLSPASGCSSSGLREKYVERKYDSLDGLLHYKGSALEGVLQERRPL